MANEGSLTKYARQIATDSVNQFNASYNQKVSDDLGLTWFQYVGSLLTTSREFCIEMTKKRYFHISEVEEMLKGNIGDVHVHINPKTKLPDGFIEGTTKQSFFINRAGYMCGHQIFPVPMAAVPADIRAKFSGGGASAEAVPIEVQVQPTELKVSKFISSNTVEGAEKNELEWINTLTDKQKQSLINYTSSNYIEINGALRGRAGFEDLLNEKTFKDEINNLSKTLLTAPKYRGTSYRGMWFDESKDFNYFVNNLKEGKLFIDKAFLSSSINKGSVSRFMEGEYKILFTIEGKNGVLLKEISNIPEDMEILFNKNSKFIIKSIKNINTNEKNIILTEL